MFVSFSEKIYLIKKLCVNLYVCVYKLEYRSPQRPKEDTGSLGDVGESFVYVLLSLVNKETALAFDRTES